MVVGEWFWLPRLGGDVFKKLVNEAGLKYDRSKGFQATSETDLGLVVSILKSTLEEDVEVLLKCFICGAPVECQECRYKDACESARGFQTCICGGCETGEETSDVYSIRFTELLG